MYWILTHFVNLLLSLLSFQKILIKDDQIIFKSGQNYELGNNIRTVLKKNGGCSSHYKWYDRAVLTLKRVGGGNIAHQTLFDLITPLFGLRAGAFISLNSGMSMTVILAPPRGLQDERYNSDPAGKPEDQHFLPNFYGL